MERVALDPTSLSIISGVAASQHEALVNRHATGIVWVIPLLNRVEHAVLAKRTHEPGNIVTIAPDFNIAFERALQCLP